MPKKKQGLDLLQSEKGRAKREVAILRDDVFVLKQRVGLYFEACDEGLVELHTKEKEPLRLLEESLKRVNLLKGQVAAVITNFKPRFDG